MVVGPTSPLEDLFVDRGSYLPSDLLKGLLQGCMEIEVNNEVGYVFKDSKLYVSVTPITLGET